MLDTNKGCGCGCNCGKNSGDEGNKEKLLKQIIDKYRHTNGALIPILHEAQGLFGCLPFDVQTKISDELDIPLAEIYGVVSFYTQFCLEPKGTYSILVCMGTACYVKGAGALVEKLKDILDIEVGECTGDRKFSLDVCRCIGACGLAPAITINGKVYGGVTPERLEEIIESYK